MEIKKGKTSKQKKAAIKMEEHKKALSWKFGKWKYVVNLAVQFGK